MSMSVFRVWLVFFAYSVMAAAFVQLLLLPVLLPEFHWRDGLLIVGDWHYFQPFAEKMVKAIHLHGWSKWFLRPSGQAPGGIAAAIYAVTVPKPYVLIPLFAALHATGAVMMMRLVELFGIRRRLAVFAALPFLLGPTAILWFTQIHKDTLYAPGLVFCLYGWVYLLRMKTVGEKILIVRRLMVFFLSISAGIFLVWVVRPQYIEIFTVFAFIMLILGLCVMAVRVYSGLVVWRNAVVMAIALAAVPASLLTLKAPKVTMGMSYFDKQIESTKTTELPKTEKIVELPKADKTVELPEGIKAVGMTKNGRLLMLLKTEKTVELPKAEETVELPKAEETVELPKAEETVELPKAEETVELPKAGKTAELPKAGKFIALPESVGAIKITEEGRLLMIPRTEKKVSVPKAKKPAGDSELLWQPSPILPDSLDLVLKRVYAYRQYFYRATSRGNPGSTFDRGRFLNSFENIVRYLPRAIQLGMFSPFPNRWLEPSTTPVYTIMRRVNGLEMFCLYVAMLGLVPAIYYWRRRFEFWVVFVFFGYFTLVPVIILPNIGTMVRYRYAPIMALGGLGIAAIGVWLQGRRRARDGGPEQAMKVNSAKDERPTSNIEHSTSNKK
ncbi:MAG: hypothetical protein H8E00_00845 [Deltaproteobacteria bacterium]|nr:hypothetical protein [Deltaproteobacteria bacterium]